MPPRLDAASRANADRLYAQREAARRAAENEKVRRGTLTARERNNNRAKRARARAAHHRKLDEAAVTAAARSQAAVATRAATRAARVRKAKEDAQFREQAVARLVATRTARAARRVAARAPLRTIRVIFRVDTYVFEQLEGGDARERGASFLEFEAKLSFPIAQRSVTTDRNVIPRILNNHKAMYNLWKQSRKRFQQTMEVHYNENDPQMGEKQHFVVDKAQVGTVNPLWTHEHGFIGPPFRLNADGTPSLPVSVTSQIFEVNGFLEAAAAYKEGKTDAAPLAFRPRVRKNVYNFAEFQLVVEASFHPQSVIDTAHARPARTIRATRNPNKRQDCGIMVLKGMIDELVQDGAAKKVWTTCTDTYAKIRTDIEQYLDREICRPQEVYTGLPDTSVRTSYGRSSSVNANRTIGRNGKPVKPEYQSDGRYAYGVTASELCNFVSSNKDYDRLSIIVLTSAFNAEMLASVFATNPHHGKTAQACIFLQAGHFVRFSSRERERTAITRFTHVAPSASVQLDLGVHDSIEMFEMALVDRPEDVQIINITSSENAANPPPLTAGFQLFRVGHDVPSFGRLISGLIGELTTNDDVLRLHASITDNIISALYEATSHTLFVPSRSQESEDQAAALSDGLVELFAAIRPRGENVQSRPPSWIAGLKAGTRQATGIASLLQESVLNSMGSSSAALQSVYSTPQQAEVWRMQKNLPITASYSYSRAPQSVDRSNSHVQALRAAGDFYVPGQMDAFEGMGVGMAGFLEFVGAPANTSPSAALKLIEQFTGFFIPAHDIDVIPLNTKVGQNKAIRIPRATMPATYVSFLIKRLATEENNVYKRLPLKEAIDSFFSPYSFEDSYEGDRPDLLPHACKCSRVIPNRLVTDIFTKIEEVFPRVHPTKALYRSLVMPLIGGLGRLYRNEYDTEIQETPSDCLDSILKLEKHNEEGTYSLIPIGNNRSFILSTKKRTPLEKNSLPISSAMMAQTVQDIIQTAEALAADDGSSVINCINVDSLNMSNAKRDVIAAMVESGDRKLEDPKPSLWATHSEYIVSNSAPQSHYASWDGDSDDEEEEGASANARAAKTVVFNTPRSKVKPEKLQDTMEEHRSLTKKLFSRSKLFIGKPGAGKSYQMNKLLLEAAQHEDNHCVFVGTTHRLVQKGIVDFEANVEENDLQVLAQVEHNTLAHYLGIDEGTGAKADVPSTDAPAFVQGPRGFPPTMTHLFFDEVLLASHASLGKIHKLLRGIYDARKKTKRKLKKLSYDDINACLDLASLPSSKVTVTGTTDHKQLNSVGATTSPYDTPIFKSMFSDRIHLSVSPSENQRMDFEAATVVDHLDEFGCIPAEAFQRAYISSVQDLKRYKSEELAATSVYRPSNLRHSFYKEIETKLPKWKLGDTVRTTTTDPTPEKRYRNGDACSVIGVEGNKITVRTPTQGEVSFPKGKLEREYVCSIYRLQGASLPHEVKKFVIQCDNMDKRAIYTAISRCRRWDQIALVGECCDYAYEQGEDLEFTSTKDVPASLPCRDETHPKSPDVVYAVENPDEPTVLGTSDNIPTLTRWLQQKGQNPKLNGHSLKPSGTIRVLDVGSNLRHAERLLRGWRIYNNLYGINTNGGSSSVIPKQLTPIGPKLPLSRETEITCTLTKKDGAYSCRMRYQPFGAATSQINIRPAQLHVVKERVLAAIVKRNEAVGIHSNPRLVFEICG